jgi:hypothetical protein
MVLSGLTSMEQVCDLLSKSPSHCEYGSIIYTWYNNLPKIIQSLIHDNVTKLVLKATSSLKQNSEFVPINYLASDTPLYVINLELYKKQVFYEYLERAIQNALLEDKHIQEIQYINNEHINNPYFEYTNEHYNNEHINNSYFECNNNDDVLSHDVLSQDDYDVLREDDDDVLSQDDDDVLSQDDDDVLSQDDYDVLGPHDV